MTACNPFTESDQLQVDGAEGSRAVLSSDGVVHHTASNIFELLITDRFCFVGLFAHCGWVFGLVVFGFSKAQLEHSEGRILTSQRIRFCAQEAARYCFKLGVRKIGSIVGEILRQNYVHQIVSFL